MTEWGSSCNVHVAKNTVFYRICLAAINKTTSTGTPRRRTYSCHHNNSPKGIRTTHNNAPPPPTHRTDSTGGRSKTKHRARSKRLVWRISSRPSEGPSPLVEQPESNAVVHRPLDHRRPQAAKKSFAQPLSSRDLAQRVKEPPYVRITDKSDGERELTRYARNWVLCETDE